MYNIPNGTIRWLISTSIKMYNIPNGTIRWLISTSIKMYNIPNGTIRWRISTSIKIVLEHFSPALIISQILNMNSTNFATLKIQVRVTMRNIRNGTIRWLVSTSIKVVFEYFSYALIVFQILNNMLFRNVVTLKIQINIIVFNSRNGAIRWQIPDSVSNGNSNVCSISHHLRDIGKILKFNKF